MNLIVFAKLPGPEKQAFKLELNKYKVLTAYVLYHVMVMYMNFFHYDSFSTGLISAFWMWLGFIMPVQITNVMFGKDSWKLFYINTGYQLVSVLGMGATIGLMM